MCKDASPEDLVRSRRRRYDLPAMLFFHRPVRCHKCEERFYVFKWGANKLGWMPRLWMHYALLAVLLVIAGILAAQVKVGWTHPKDDVVKTPAKQDV